MQSKMENRFTSVMSERSNEELMDILLRKRDDYQFEAVDAARNELRRRKLSHQQFEEITDWIQKKKQQEQEKDEYRQSWIESMSNYFRVPANLPMNIKIGAWLIYFSLLFDMLRIFLLHHHEITHSSPGLPTIMATAIYVFIAYMIHTGKNWARLIFITFLFTHLLLYPFYLESSFQTGIVFGSLLSAALGARLAVLALLLGKSAKNWYRSNHGTFVSPGNIQMRKPVMALIIAILFGVYMFRPIIANFYQFKAYSIWVTLLIVLGNMVLLICIFFLWYGYLRREFFQKSC
ncbi:MAG: hypothetical protein V5A51_08110 [Bacteroidales bacterium]